MAADTPNTEEPDNPNTTSRFELDGREYEVPDFLDLDIDDWEIIYDECKVVLADFQSIAYEGKDEKEAARAERMEAARMERVRNPRLEKAFIMVGIRRARPDDDLDTIRADAGRVKLVPYLTQVTAGAEENPTPATTLDESLKPSSDSSNGNSSLDSPESLETPEDQPEAIGTDV